MSCHERLPRTYHLGKHLVEAYRQEGREADHWEADPWLPEEAFDRVGKVDGLRHGTVRRKVGVNEIHTHQMTLGGRRNPWVVVQTEAVRLSAEARIRNLLEEDRRQSHKLL
jgi:hypothetical protein